MKALILAPVILICLISFSAHANITTNILSAQKEQAKSCDISQLLILKDKKLPSCSSESENFEEARQGCCSHHNGVCGCAGDRALCCDGQLSPSCGC